MMEWMRAGGILMWVLLALSVVAVTVVFGAIAVLSKGCGGPCFAGGGIWKGCLCGKQRGGVADCQCAGQLPASCF